MQIHFVDPHRWRSLAAFNPNAFPAASRAVVDASGFRLSLVLYHSSALAVALDAAAADFQRMLDENRADLISGIQRRPDLPVVAVYDGVGFMSEAHNLLNATKSFLDLYAKLIGKLFNERNEWSFGKASIGGRKLAGGRFINALRESSPDGTDASLADMVFRHSTEWITEAVTYRDQLSHRSDLNHMVPMCLPVRQEAPHLHFEDLVAPVMPNGTELRAYSANLTNRLIEYVSDSIQLAPNVDLTLVSLEGLRRDPREFRPQ